MAPEVGDGEDPRSDMGRFRKKGRASQVGSPVRVYVCISARLHMCVHELVFPYMPWACVCICVKH